jgi:hypothetical protein
MTRAELLAFLTRCVRDGVITTRRAAELLLAFDNGTLDPVDLPTEQEDSDLVPVLLLATAALIALLHRLGYSVEQLLVIPAAAQDALKEALRVEFQVRSRALARLLQQSGDVNAWQSGMADLVKRNIVESAIVGAGRILTPAELAFLQPAAEEQLAFIARFADRIALQEMVNAPLSEAQIAARSETYGRTGLAVVALFNELSGDFGPGWVASYIALDDRGTCSNCHGAQGDYEIGSGPMPGEICFGGMRCRCRREVRFDPAAYARLTGTIERAA